jgi:hypothetical protein
MPSVPTAIARSSNFQCHYQTFPIERFLFEGGVCDPLAVKAKPNRAKNADRVVARNKAGLRPAPLHVFWPVTAQPPLIAAWLVGFMRTRKPRKDRQ